MLFRSNENCDIDNHDDGHDDYWITYNIHDLKIFQLEDIMIGIQSWSYIWFNIFFESFKSNGHGHGHHYRHLLVLVSQIYLKILIDL